MNADDRLLLTEDEIIEAVSEDEPDMVKNHIEELEVAGYIRTKVLDDNVGYHARDGLTWSEVKNISDPYKKKILLQMIPNPKTFFVLFNTQKGKAKIISKEIKSWVNEEKKVVALVILDNDLTLGDQSAESFADTIGRDNVELFPLSSSNKTTLLSILTYIDAYSTCPGYKMPLIMALANDIQCKKVLKILSHIRDAHMNGRSHLVYGMAWDEADKIYPMLREKKLESGTCMRDFTMDGSSLHRLGFVTATEGSLLDEEYPECANAFMYPAEISEEDKPFYRAFHHEDAVRKYIQCPKAVSNNAIALDMIDKNLVYFNSPLTLPTREVYYRKMIINSNAKGADMRDFALEVNKRGINALVFNQLGLVVYKCGETHVRIKIKKRWFARVVFYAYKKFGLQNAPLVIIGRRKVDRGLGFTYAPRRGRQGPTEIDEGYGPIQTDGVEGLVWTDEFLGHIEDKATAVQKAGRLAAICAQCPQYPGTLTWWTDESTGNQIDHHCRVVDSANDQKGANTFLQAITRAKAEVPLVKVSKEKGIDYGLSEPFDHPNEAKKWCIKNLTYNCSEYKRHNNPCTCTGSHGTCIRENSGPGETYIKYRGELRPLYSEAEIRSSPEHGRGNTDARIMPVLTIGTTDHARIMPVKTDIQWGVKDSARVMPATTPSKIVWIVIYKLEKLRKA
jgi:hypothetical protein